MSQNPFPGQPGQYGASYGQYAYATPYSQPPRKKWGGAMWLGVLAGLVVVALVTVAVRYAVRDETRTPLSDICPTVEVSLSDTWGVTRVDDRQDSDDHQSLAVCVLQDDQQVTTMTVTVERVGSSYRSASEEAADRLEWACISSDHTDDDSCAEDLGSGDDPYGRKRVEIIEDGETVLQVIMRTAPGHYDDVTSQVDATVTAFTSK